GICYGMQTMAAQLGGRTASAAADEYGHAEVDIVAECALFEGMNDHATTMPKLDVWMSHGDHVEDVPPGFEVTARTERVPVAAMAHQSKPWYGGQFHPEVTHTVQGRAILKRFVSDICGCRNLWTSANIIEDQIARVRAAVGDDHVL